MDSGRLSHLATAGKGIMRVVVVSNVLFTGLVREASRKRAANGSSF
jgi:hypothetical protein